MRDDRETIVLGVSGAAAVTRDRERLLFDLTPLDPTTFIAASLMFAVLGPPAIDSASRFRPNRGGVAH